MSRDRTDIILTVLALLAIAVIAGMYVWQWNTYKEELGEYEYLIEQRQDELAMKQTIADETVKYNNILDGLKKDEAEFLVKVPGAVEEDRFFGEIGVLAEQAGVKIDEPYSWPPEGSAVKIKIVLKGADEDLEIFRGSLGEIKRLVAWTDRGVIEYGKLIMKGNIFYLPRPEEYKRPESDGSESDEEYIPAKPAKLKTFLPPYSSRIRALESDLRKMDTQTRELEENMRELEGAKKINKNIKVREKIIEKAGGAIDPPVDPPVDPPDSQPEEPPVLPEP